MTELQYWAIAGPIIIVLGIAIPAFLEWKYPD